MRKLCRCRRASRREAYSILRNRREDCGGTAGYVARISCRHRRCSHGFQHLHQLIQFCAAEQAIWPVRRDVGEWGFIEPIRGDNTVLRKVIDDEVHELDLVG